jgi:hypothetical protein
MEGFFIENPRFRTIAEALKRTVVSHAMLQNDIAHSFFKRKPFIWKCILKELSYEHQRIMDLLDRILAAPSGHKIELDALVRRVRTLIRRHLYTEQKFLSPLSDGIVVMPSIRKAPSLKSPAPKTVPLELFDLS